MRRLNSEKRAIILNAVCNVHCATYRVEHANGEGYWSLEAIDSERQEYTVNHEDLLGAVCILAELLDVDLSDV
ncbi:MAG: hypothetical protein IH984_12175 [Planctomycetes bacterium]|nr:hypothetical protein [Planctomycetota bacterium]